VRSSRSLSYKKLPAFYENRIFMAAFITARNWILSWFRLIKSKPSYFTFLRPIIIVSTIYAQVSHVISALQIFRLQLCTHFWLCIIKPSTNSGGNFIERFTRKITFIYRNHVLHSSCCAILYEVMRLFVYCNWLLSALSARSWRNLSSARHLC
jgi:hypothetical protein